MADVLVRNIARSYGAYRAVDDISFQVKDGEFLTLLGPSGCGKSTTLNILAGLDKPDSGFLSVGGDVFFDSSVGTFVAAERRNLGLVFQSYALWPHMTVYENVAFSLRLRKIAKAERDSRVHEALALVEMDSFATRYPSQLSGGQQQRVALARTLAYRPKMLLLDEPLSNLDAKLRDKARSWLRQLQTQVGVTTIFVTHDQVEALALSDRIAVMNKGRIVQIGTPTDIYERPSDTFVADFIGSSNFLNGQVTGLEQAGIQITLPDGQMLQALRPETVSMGSQVVIACRPERIEIVSRSEPVADNVLVADLVEKSYLGTHNLYHFKSGDNVLKVETSRQLEASVALRLPKEHCAVFVR